MAFTAWFRVMNVARNSVGRVPMSPRAVTIGVVTAPVREHRKPDGEEEDEHRAQRPADHRDRHEVPYRDGPLAERERRQPGQDGQPQRRGERGDQCHLDVLVEDAVAVQGHLEQTGVGARAEASTDRPEDRAAHPDGCGDQDQEPGKLRERVGDVAERQAGNEGCERAEGEGGQPLAQRSLLSAQGGPQAPGTTWECHNGTLIASFSGPTGMMGRGAARGSMRPDRLRGKPRPPSDPVAGEDQPEGKAGIRPVSPEPAGHGGVAHGLPPDVPGICRPGPGIEDQLGIAAQRQHDVRRRVRPDSRERKEPPLELRVGEILWRGPPQRLQIQIPTADGPGHREQVRASGACPGHFPIEALAGFRHGPGGGEGPAVRAVPRRARGGRAEVLHQGPDHPFGRGPRAVGGADGLDHLLEHRRAPDHPAGTCRHPDLAWGTSGAGGMVRSPTVFEEVVKTICTTNCTWSATKRMVGALVEHLGAPAPGAPRDGPYGRAFPTPRAMAEASEGFYREVARAGYRGPHLLSVARSVSGGDLDLETLGRASPEDLPDAELERRLLALPGVGPYAAAHVMLTLGRYSKLILDSWTRPAYARHVGRKAVSDAAMARRFRRYGPYAGLAFWLILTRDWV